MRKKMLNINLSSGLTNKLEGGVIYWDLFSKSWLKIKFEKNPWREKEKKM